MPAGFSPETRLPTLWTDTPDAIGRLRALQATGMIDQGEASDLAHFIEHGWLIWPGLIEETRLQDLARDLADLSSRPGYFVTTDPAHGAGKRLNGRGPVGGARLLDLYVNLQSSRQICMHWRIARFLSLLFQAKPLAFAQSVSSVSPGWAWHQDPASIVVDNPMLLAGVSVALDTIAGDSGEHAFYDASHRLPPYLFANGRLHHDGHTSVERYARDLEAACQERGLRYCRLLANRGDVFFWSPGLVHRSHPGSGNRVQENLTCVTHYCPATSMPHWFADPAQRGIEPFFDLGGFASAHYRLPNLSQIIRPVPSWEFAGAAG